MNEQNLGCGGFVRENQRAAVGKPRGIKPTCGI